QLIDDRGPRRIELRSSGWSATVGDPVRLFDERDREALRNCGLPCRDEVRRLHATARPVAEDKRDARIFHRVEVSTSQPVWGIDLEGRHGKRFRSLGMTISRAAPWPAASSPRTT